MQIEKRVWVRWALLLIGVAVVAVAFAGLIDEDDRTVHTSPWWIFGLIGLVLVLLALGSPRRAE